MKQYSRRQFLTAAGFTLGAAALPSLLVACATQPTSTQSAPTAGSGASQAPAVQTTRTLRVLSHAGASEPGLRAMAKQFQDIKKGTVTVEITATPLTQLHTKAMAEFVAKSDAFDLLTLNDQWAGAWAPHLVPLKELPGYTLKDHEHLIPALMGMSESKGVVYGLPHRVGANILFYRKDLLEQKQLAVPKTQDEYLEVARALTGGGVYGIAIEAKGSPYSTLDFVTLLWARGEREIDESFTKPLLDQAPSVDVARFYTELFTKHKVVPPDSLSYTYEQMVTGMQQGTVGMMIDYSARVAAIENPQNSKVAGKVGYALVPLGRGITRRKGCDYIAGHSLVVSKYGKEKELAYEFAKFATSDQAQLEMAMKNGNGPTTESAYRNPEYAKVVPAAPVVLEALKTARTRPSIPQWNDMDLALGEELTSIFTGKKTPEAAMKDANSRWAALLKG